MPLNFCLPRDRVESFKQGIRSGEIDPEQLARMSSEDRRAVLGKYVGEHAAPQVNAEFESKLLLKNQQQGYLNWAKNVTGIKEPARRDLIKRIQNMEPILNSGQSDNFLKDLASRRLGTEVTDEEAQRIAELSKRVSETEAKQTGKGKFASKEDRLSYGRSIEDMTDYVADLKNEATRTKLRDLTSVSGITKEVVNAPSKVAGNLKSLNASLDDSAVFKQGWKTIFTNPVIWAKGATKSLSDIVKVVGGKNVLRETNADIISRENALNGRYNKMGLAVKNPEEAFPEGIIAKADKIPGVKKSKVLNFFPTVLSRLYKASEQAYTAFLYRTRADIADKMIGIAEEGGMNVDDKDQLKAIGKMINSLTGRGDLGKIEPIAGVVNNVFFSPRLLKANFDTLTAHQVQKGVTPFVRKQAALNLVKIAGGTASILAMADFLAPGSVDWDPRSTDFGKIKIGDTRFDVTGGSGSLITLLMREITGKSVSASGTVSDLANPQNGGPDYISTVGSFFRNKLSPAAGMAVTLRTGTNGIGQKVSPTQAISNAVTPLGIQNLIELHNDPNSAGVFAGELADFFGISTNTYAPQKSNSWADSTSKDITTFKNKVGDDRFTQANKQYDDKVNALDRSLSTNEAFQALSDADKLADLNKKKGEIKKQVFKDNGFAYKAPKADKNKYNGILK